MDRVQRRMGESEKVRMESDRVTFHGKKSSLLVLLKYEFQSPGHFKIGKQKSEKVSQLRTSSALPSAGFLNPGLSI